MVLSEKIEELIRLGYSVAFSREIMHLKVLISFNNCVKGQYIPMRDQFDEVYIVGAIDFLVNQIKLNL